MASVGETAPHRFGSGGTNECLRCERPKKNSAASSSLLRTGSRSQSILRRLQYGRSGGGGRARRGGVSNRVVHVGARAEPVQVLSHVLRRWRLRSYGGRPARLACELACRFWARRWGAMRSQRAWPQGESPRWGQSSKRSDGERMRIVVIMWRSRARATPCARVSYARIGSTARSGKPS